MDDGNPSCTYDSEENAQLSPLQCLPMEIFLHICSFLDGSTLVHGLSLACTQFYRILNGANSLWKAQIKHIWPDANYPLFPFARPDNLSWMSSYVTIKQETALWEQHKSRQKRFFIKKMPDGHINPVLLMHVNGIYHTVYTSNKYLAYQRLPLGESSLYTKRLCPVPCFWKGINDLTAIDNTIYSCDDDNTVKSWELTNTGLVHQSIYHFAGLISHKSQLRSALCCISSCPETKLFATGSSSGTVYVFDSRCKLMPNMTISYRPDMDSVIRLAMNTDYILSFSDDETVSIWDQRARRTMKSIKFPGKPSCISMQRDLIFVGTKTWKRCYHMGDTGVKLHVLNPKDDFKIVKSYSTERYCIITRVHLTHECLITSFRDGTVNISSLTDPPKPLVTFRANRIREIYNMAYLNGILAVSGYEGIEVWCPELTCSTKQQQIKNVYT